MVASNLMLIKWLLPILCKFQTSDFLHKRVYIIDFGHIKQDSQPAITCSKLTIETLEQGVKYVQS